MVFASDFHERPQAGSSSLWIPAVSSTYRNPPSIELLNVQSILVRGPMAATLQYPMAAAKVISRRVFGIEACKQVPNTVWWIVRS